MLKVREIKALARQTLIGRYGTLILAGIVAAVLVFLSSAAMLGGFAAALNWSGVLAGPDGNGYSIVKPGVNLHIYSDAAPSMPLMIVGVIVFTIFLIITLILLIWFYIGKRKLMLNICRGDRYGLGDLFYGFSAEAHPFRVIFASIARFLIHNLVGLIALGVFFGSSRILRDMPDASLELKKWLPIVLIVIMALIQLNIDIGYTFAELSIIDRPETRVGEALKHSREVTKGRKLKLIWMALFSFIFWYLLICVCRFTALWILPYIRAAYTVLYLDGDGSAWQLPPNRPSYKASQYPQKPEVKETAVKAEGKAETALPAAPAASEAKAEPAAEAEAKPAFEAPHPLHMDDPEYSAPSQTEIPAEAVPAPEPAPEAVPAQSMDGSSSAGVAPVPDEFWGEKETPFEQWFKEAYKDVLDKKET
jgi:uncharacterized membrane protein